VVKSIMQGDRGISSPMRHRVSNLSFYFWRIASHTFCLRPLANVNHFWALGFGLWFLGFGFGLGFYVHGYSLRLGYAPKPHTAWDDLQGPCGKRLRTCMRTTA
jgi:hypothetical protein